MGNLCFWLAICVGLLASLAYLDGEPGPAALAGFLALAIAGCGICAGLIEHEEGKEL